MEYKRKIFTSTLYNKSKNKSIVLSFFLYFFPRLCYTISMQTLLKNTNAYQLLKKEKESEGFSHAYLLCFDDAAHLKTALKCFAQLFFDENERASKLIDEDAFVDCLSFPEEGKKLVVEDAEKIVEESALAPVEGERKVFLIGDFAEANAQTQNKLLKVLEEPPKGVIFLLGTTSVFPVLPTVLSRTKRLEILPFSVEEVTACLRRIEGNGHTTSALNLCAAACGGNVGVARTLLEGGYYQSLVDGAFELLLCEKHTLPALVKKLGETPRKKELLNLLRILFRDGLLLKKNMLSSLLLPTEKERISLVAKKYNVGALLFAQEALSTAEKQVNFNAIFSQCLELCICNILEKNR